MELDSTQITTFCDLYFAVPGHDEHPWYDPFGAAWPKNQPNGGWPVGSVLTQLRRPNAKLRAAMITTVSGSVANVEFRPDDDYFAALDGMVPPARRIPLRELAVWRYRFGTPAELAADADVTSLVEALLTELHLSEGERARIFTDQTAPNLEKPEEQTLWVTDAAWNDDALAEVLAAPEQPQTVEVPAPAPPTDDPQVEEDDYLALEEFALLPLQDADVEALIQRAQVAVDKRGLLLADPELLEQCVLALLTGHLVLQGPPGTGKTTLARALAEAFDCSSELQTATADWSTYDVIGGLQPTIGANDQEVLRPWLGHVPRAALRCARTARAHDEDSESEPCQAHWLIIDEFSRAQVDKAIGGLYTMLGGSGEQSLELWFENDPARKVVPIPSRFRIIATMNDVDASFVYDFSQGLSRRFQFVYVGVPRREQLKDEILAALKHAAVWMAGQYPERARSRDSTELFERWQADARMQPVLNLLEAVVTRLRYPAAGAAGGGWPLGTAQLGDVLRHVALRELGSDDLLPVLDSALANRVIPQMSGVKPVVLQDLLTWLRDEHADQLARTIRAAGHLRDTAATA
ncbi:AAA family ATPase [Blastococcus goldschmidtiae]|uniref:AAA family ATPase n=1 Tax=Blastococcus goldschmidtiae TaxID=3075546 RepID=A0ABU2K7C8_9ACTN|nr:AAA family ATPase [Blastococcus sp. DSM 46792]MDT0276076.1 AAA family ATPase [Blastococcus sp. DSM 46792]